MHDHFSAFVKIYINSQQTQNIAATLLQYCNIAATLLQCCNIAATLLQCCNIAAIFCVCWVTISFGYQFIADLTDELIISPSRIDLIWI